MTAGGGVLHQEMPKPSKDGKMHGLQLWVNLPAKDKMMEPRYRGISAGEVPSALIPGGKLKVIAGKYRGVTGPVKDLVVDTEYFDVSLGKGASFEHAARAGYTSFCYVVEGKGEFDGQELWPGKLAAFSEAGAIKVKSIDDLRYIYVSGKQLREPIAWGGPVVMNTKEELDAAFEELSEGRFIRKDAVATGV
jgi:redox-sensitive bicupin YhaK (pirin superfamily)